MTRDELVSLHNEAERSKKSAGHSWRWSDAFGLLEIAATNLIFLIDTKVPGRNGD